MNEYIAKIIESYYKTFGIYKVKIVKSVSSNSNLCVYLDITFAKNVELPYGSTKRVFYDYLSDKEIEDELYDYFYYTKRDQIDKKDLMSEQGIIVIGNIELKKVKRNGHIETYHPLLIQSKSKFTENFKKYIVSSCDINGVSATQKELSSLKGLKISKTTIYNLLNK